MGGALVMHLDSRTGISADMQVVPRCPRMAAVKGMQLDYADTAPHMRA